MMRTIPVLLAGSLLAACEPTSPSASGGTAAVSGGAPRAAVTDAEMNCVSALIAQTGVPGVMVTGTRSGQLGTVVSLSLPGDAATWTCQAEPDGIVVAEVVRAGA